MVHRCGLFVGPRAGSFAEGLRLRAADGGLGNRRGPVRDRDDALVLAIAVPAAERAATTSPTRVPAMRTLLAPAGTPDAHAHRHRTGPAGAVPKPRIRTGRAGAGSGGLVAGPEGSPPSTSRSAPVMAGLCRPRCPPRRCPRSAGSRPARDPASPTALATPRPAAAAASRCGSRPASTNPLDVVGVALVVAARARGTPPRRPCRMTTGGRVGAGRRLRCGKTAGGPFAHRKARVDAGLRAAVVLVGPPVHR